MLDRSFPEMDIVGACRAIEFQLGKHLNMGLIAMAPTGFVLKQYVWIEQTAFEIAKFYIENAEIHLNQIQHVVRVDRGAEIQVTDKCDRQTIPCTTCHYPPPRIPRVVAVSERLAYFSTNVHL